MKTKLLLTLSLLIWLTYLNPSFAKEQQEKTKVIEKSYQVNSATKLTIDNKFGRVEINTWDRNEFSVKVEIIGKGRTEERAQRQIEDIDVDIIEGSSGITFETKISNNKSKNNDGFEINYTVYMPSRNPLKIENKFGDVTMGDRAGNLELNVKYGSISVGDVSGRTSLILGFGNGLIGEIGVANMEIKYSKFEIESASRLDLEQSYSKIRINEIETLDLESKYGGINIGKANTIDSEVSYSGFEIEELTGSIELEAKYVGGFKIEKLAKEFTLVDIEGKYSSYEIGIVSGTNANISAEFSYANLKADSDLDITFNYQVKESSKSTYRGKIGQGDSGKSIRVESGYGNLKLEEY